MQKKKLLAVLLSVAMMITAISTEGIQRTPAHAEDSGFQNLDQEQITEAMGVGINLGNSLEANRDGTPNETAWGNPSLTEQFVQSVKSAGFQSVRIPVSYLSKIDDNNGYKIDSAWLDRVQQVVDYCIRNDMYAIINMHGDGYNTVQGGWLLCNGSDQTKIKEKYKACWEQIADRFKDYDEHLIFESMNEEFDGTYSDPNKDYYNNINEYNQIFVDTVRQTGGNNDQRWLLIPGWNTNIGYTTGNYGFRLPTDQYLSSEVSSDEKRIMISVHYYDPWEFCGTESGEKTQWGESVTDSSKEPNWGNETYMASQFKKLNQKFVSQGYPVVIGEFGAIDKLALDSRNKVCRTEYYQKVCYYAKQYHLIPVAWDNGDTKTYGFCLLDRYSGQIVQPEIVNAMMKVYHATSTATGIALDQEQITVHVGDEGVQLHASLTPADSKDMVSWSSDNEKVATVDASGMVTAAGAGECTITASVDAGYKAVCKVIVPKMDYIRVKLYLNNTSNWSTNASEQNADIKVEDQEYSLSMTATDEQLKNIGSLYIKDIQADQSEVIPALSSASVKVKSIVVNGKVYFLTNDTYTYDRNLKKENGLSKNKFDFAFINIWADSYVNDVTVEKNRAYFNEVSYQGTNTIAVNFAISEAKTTQSEVETSPTPGTNTSPTPGTEVSPTPGTNTSPTPGAEVSPTPGTNTSPTPGTEVSATPGTNTSPTPGTNASPTPGTEVSPTPGTNTTPTPGTNASPTPGVTPIVSNGPGSNISSGMDQGINNGGNSTQTAATGIVLNAKVKGVKKLALKSKYKLASRKKMKISVKSLPAGTTLENVTYSSSNPSIFKVSDKGVVTAGRKAGKAVLIVTTENGICKKVQIQIMKKTVSKLKFQKNLKMIKKGRKFKLKVKAKPGKKYASDQYYWKSSNRGRAVVSSNGVVKTKKKGKVKITVYATDGSGKKASVTVRVK